MQEGSQTDPRGYRRVFSDVTDGLPVTMGGHREPTSIESLLAGLLQQRKGGSEWGGVTGGSSEGLLAVTATVPKVQKTHDFLLSVGNSVATTDLDDFKLLNSNSGNL